MATLTCLATGQKHSVPDTTAYCNGFWIAGDERFFDPSGDSYTLLEVAATDKLTVAKAIKLAAVVAAAQTALAALATGYPDWEVSTWDQQLREAQLVAADNTLAADLAEGVTDTIPLIRQMATARTSLGDTVAARIIALAGRIRTNAAAWSPAAGAIIGKRQAMEDAVGAAGTPEAVASVVVDFSTTTTAASNTSSTETTTTETITTEATS